MSKKYPIRDSEGKLRDKGGDEDKEETPPVPMAFMITAYSITAASVLYIVKTLMELTECGIICN